MEKNNTAVIILNYNNFEDTINCIESVEQFNTAPIKYIIVDNGSTRKGTIEAINNYLSKKFKGQYNCLKEDDITNELNYVTFIVSHTNDGYARGNNKGLNIAYKDDTISNILILNNDVLFVEDIIPQLIFQLENLPNCAIVSPILYKKYLKGIDYNCARNNVKVTSLIRDNFLHYFYRLYKKKDKNLNLKNYILKKTPLPYPKIIPIELPSGSCMLLKKNLFNKIGSFDPNTFLYWEENILFKKIERLGLQNYLCSYLKCIHLGASSTSSSRSLFIINCNLHSSRYYVNKYSGCSKLVYYLYYLSSLFFKFTFILQKKLAGKNL